MPLVPTNFNVVATSSGNPYSAQATWTNADPDADAIVLQIALDDGAGNPGALHAEVELAGPPASYVRADLPGVRTHWRIKSRVTVDLTARRGIWSYAAVTVPIGQAVVSAWPPPAITAATRERYVSPSGSGTAYTQANPGSLEGARDSSQPGDHIILMNGTYNLASTFFITDAGTPNAWIVYRAQNVRQATLQWTPLANNAMFRCRTGAEYLEFRDLNWTGGTYANVALGAQRTNNSDPIVHHIRFVNNMVEQMGKGGISFQNCDYMWTMANDFHRCGHTNGTGFSSAVSHWTNKWLDRDDGFHHFIIGNRISGGWDPVHLSDGSGIIMDEPENTSTTPHDVPPFLIANNVSFMNGARGITVLRADASDMWVVNNSTFGNGMDTNICSPGGSCPGIQIRRTTANTRIINNIGHASFNETATRTYREVDNPAGESSFPNASATYVRNVAWPAGRSDGLPGATTSDTAQYREVNPAYTGPLPAATYGSHLTAPHPNSIGTMFRLGSGSAARGIGIRPWDQPGLDPTMVAQMQQYLSVDVDGRPRPTGTTNWDVGAYQETGN